MTLSEFAAITKGIIRKQGFAEFLPVACFPERRDIRALSEIPETADIETVALEWAKSISSENEEFLVAFKYSASEFKIVRVTGSRLEQAIFTVE